MAQWAGQERQLCPEEVAESVEDQDLINSVRPHPLHQGNKTNKVTKPSAAHTFVHN